VPYVGVGLTTDRQVVDPHVEISPVDCDQKSRTCQAGIPASPRNDEADANRNFYHAGDENPDARVAKDGWHDGFKPSRVGEMLDTDVGVHPTKDNRHYWKYFHAWRNG